MKVTVMREEGYDLALAGIGLSFNVSNFERLEKIAEKLAPKDGGHNKFLESIVVWLDIDASRSWWAQFDTYRIGTTKQSESTMHTITHRLLTQSDFEDTVFQPALDNINKLITSYKSAESKEEKNTILHEIKVNLPEGFLQRRIVCTNYKVLKNMVWQRKTHRLSGWSEFIRAIKEQLADPHLIGLGEV